MNNEVVSNYFSSVVCILFVLENSDLFLKRCNLSFIWNEQSVDASLKAIKNQGIEWSVDRFVLAEGVISASGWCGSIRGQVISELNILLVFADDEEEKVALEMGRSRPDVLALYPALGRYSGFFVHRGIRRRDTPVSVSLSMTLEDGLCLRAPIPYYAEVQHEEKAISKLVLLRHYADRLFFHFARGNWRLIWNRLLQHVPALMATRVGNKTLAEILTNLPGDMVLIVDHALGGGANYYREKRVSILLEQGRTVLLWQFSPVTLSFQLQVLRPEGRSGLFMVKREAWVELTDCGQITEVIFNNCVSYPDPEQVPDMLAAFLGHKQVRFTFLIHDFFSVCPSHFLLDYRRKHCGIPDIEICRTCLPHIEDGLVSMYRSRDIDLWRVRWGNVLEKADEVVCFSDNTQDLLLRAYPRLSNRVITVKPHSVAYLNGSYCYPIARESLKVAVVGDINFHKGSEVFVTLIEAAQHQGIAMEFLVVGTLNANSKPDGIEETGPYQRDELGDILTRHQVHMGLMLSIWPETFSYVTHELIKLRVPLFSFAIGAQSDAVSAYELGCVHPLTEGMELLSILLEFKERLDTILLEKNTCHQ